MANKRGQHIREFKVEAEKLVTDEGVTTAKAARELEISQSVLQRWKKNFLADPVNSFSDLPHLSPELFFGDR